MERSIFRFKYIFISYLRESGVMQSVEYRSLLLILHSVDSFEDDENQLKMLHNNLTSTRTTFLLQLKIY